MKGLLTVLALFAIGEARPSAYGPHASLMKLGAENWVIGGTDAEQGVWKWQLSQQRLSGATWSHSCGASLLSTTTALSAAHCVDSVSASNVRILAGLYQRSDTTNAQTVNCDSIVVHERYQVDSASFSNDIAIIKLSGTVVLGGNVGLLKLPPSTDSFAGDICTITGWGRTSSSNVLPDTLQQADLTVLTTARCAQDMEGVGGAVIWDKHICVVDPAGDAGGCNGDSGGPLNCPDGSGGYYVSGVTSWVVSSVLGNCLPAYPTVYTRTSEYLAWIANNSV
jgi:secreted trypsin-like serine protease